MESIDNIYEKARQAKTADELLAIARENGAELTEEQANAYFERLNKSGELSEDELDNVSGGGCGGSVDMHIDGFQCPKCYSSDISISGRTGKIPLLTCGSCGYVDYGNKFEKVM